MSRPAGPLGVLMAGGRSTRYGEPKALVRVAGHSLAERGLAALRAATEDVVIVANAPEAFAGMGAETRPDAEPGLGPVGGIRTAVAWAGERGRAGALVVACDMPFASEALLRVIAGRAARGGADVVTPESGSRRGVEPLFAWYGPRCEAAIDAALAAGDRSVIGFWDGLVVDRVSLAEVRSIGDPEVLFMNVNTPEDRERAERLASGE